MSNRAKQKLALTMCNRDDRCVKNVKTRVDAAPLITVIPIIRCPFRGTAAFG